MTPELAQLERIFIACRHLQAADRDLVACRLRITDSHRRRIRLADRSDAIRTMAEQRFPSLSRRKQAIAICRALGTEQNDNVRLIVSLGGRNLSEHAIRKALGSAKATG